MKMLSVPGTWNISQTNTKVRSATTMNPPTSQEVYPNLPHEGLGQGKGTLNVIESIAMNRSLLPQSAPSESPQGTNVSTAASSSSNDAMEVKQNFAHKLFEILEKPEHSRIIKWLPDGKGWIIMDKKGFTSDILPEYYKQTQFTSFTRKLRRWNFTRVSKGPYMGAYYHKFFMRDCKYLCALMSCKNTTPCLTTVAQVRQIAIAKGHFAAASQVAADLSAHQRVALKSLEDMNKQMMREKLLNIRFRKTQLENAERLQRLRLENVERLRMKAARMRVLDNSNNIHHRVRQEIGRSASPLERMEVLTKGIPNTMLRNNLIMDINSRMLMIPNFPISRGSELLRYQQHLNPQHQNQQMNAAPHQNQMHLSMPALPPQRNGHPLPNKQFSSNNEDYNRRFRASGA